MENIKKNLIVNIITNYYASRKIWDKFVFAARLSVCEHHNIIVRQVQIFFQYISLIVQLDLVAKGIIYCAHEYS